MNVAHVLGFPRIGAARELKTALEGYWRGELAQAGLLDIGRELRRCHWQCQRDAGLDFVTVGDFSFYDHVLDTSALLGVVPPRFGWHGGALDLDTYFRMARGAAPSGEPAHACEMTKWFDTNYHYLVPEFSADQAFRLSSAALFDEVAEARRHGFNPKPVILGPITYLWLGKTRGTEFDRLTLLDRLLPAYREILDRLAALGIEWVQVDEPALVLDLPAAWQHAYERAYTALASTPVKLLLTTYFDALGNNTALACKLPVAGLHIDLVRAPNQLEAVLAELPTERVLSLGVVDGRNVWRTDLDRALRWLENAHARHGDKLWVSSSCSLLHTPVDLGREAKLDAEVKGWLAFAREKLGEVALLRRALVDGKGSVEATLREARAVQQQRRRSPRIHRAAVQLRATKVTINDERRASAFAARRDKQRERLPLPLYPTTTIGSFPQTAEIRMARRDFKAGALGATQYREKMRAEIAHAVRVQEDIGLDVLVHGEAERTDMVEYFGELLDGFAITQFGWVQSYGSRCVKPPIIFGDVARPRPMTVEWARYAQSLTPKPMKGMLTGPVTILQWSFVRDDQARAATALQIALAIRDEVTDLEHAGIGVIQIDEPALREGLPLKQREHSAYLDWAVRAFRVAASGVRDETQIHTHMCYAEFNDIIEAIAAMDADVITIETSRSDMELLDAFVAFKYPNEIGPGVYDIHSPRIPDKDEMLRLMRKAEQLLPHEHLWVNPDCGLKTRGWPEVEAALRNMVAAARELREQRA